MVETQETELISRVTNKFYFCEICKCTAAAFFLSIMGEFHPLLSYFVDL